ncbi:MULTISPECIES: response regulator transcription factor [unclassified Beijerinckia]|uniref:response regulator transcription factor n=1 Tax=unclassified Beijerinckia TaxID=2638183 RepID=UPI0008973A1C|nr:MULTISPECIES: response regulator transcription factor [unclassified Beijerinckia]MDH7799530.1 DNA-binding response OmpR family regulator [Beijerinckia sp. GAS462]SEB46033.1 two component transcriptional regulator, winged helix family [Beijerinckia sp. 28-YEA-48]
MRVLVVEDSPELAHLLIDGLKSAGFDSDHLASAVAAREALRNARYAALILDLGLPDGDGLTVLRELRIRKDPVPVLILTARGSVHDRINGLRIGADDYLVKPFEFGELVARLEALLRRPGQILGRSLQLSNVSFDTEDRQVFIDDKLQLLSARELAVLELLLRRKGNVVSKKHLEDQLFGLTGDVGSNAVEVYVHRLRKQLMNLGARIKINTVRGVGYMMTAEK